MALNGFRGDGGDGGGGSGSAVRSLGGGAVIVSVTPRQCIRTHPARAHASAHTHTHTQSIMQSRQAMQVIYPTTANTNPHHHRRTPRRRMTSADWETKPTRREPTANTKKNTHKANIRALCYLKRATTADRQPMCIFVAAGRMHRNFLCIFCAFIMSMSAISTTKKRIRLMRPIFRLGGCQTIKVYMRERNWWG